MSVMMLKSLKLGHQPTFGILFVGKYDLGIVFPTVNRLQCVYAINTKLT